LKRLFENIISDLKFWLAGKGYMHDLIIPKHWMFDDYIIYRMPGIDREYNDYTIIAVNKWFKETMTGPYRIKYLYSGIRVWVSRSSDAMLLKMVEPLETMCPEDFHDKIN
jgi:hypothetical protein